MAAAVLVLSLLVSIPASDSIPARPDTTKPSPRIVRRFEEVVVQARLHDSRSSETVHLITKEARSLPVDRLQDLLALKAGVVARGEDLHIRGGRTGELEVLLEGLDLNEPLRNRPMEVPLVAIRAADLLSGGLDAEYGGALAGVLNVHTADPHERIEGELAYRTDGGTEGARYDHAAALLGGPLGFAGLGAVVAAEATLDDDYLPSLRSRTRSKVLGPSFGWRDDNRLLGYFKLAPTGSSRLGSLQVLASRRVQRPYDPMWSFDGYVGLCPEQDCSRLDFRNDSLPGYIRYNAADHKTITDERRVAAVLSFKTRPAEWRAGASAGWAHARSITSLGGSDDFSYVNDERTPIFGDANNGIIDPFHVHWGDEPYFRRSSSDVFSARADVEHRTRRGNGIKVGLGANYQAVSLWEIDDPIGAAEPPVDRVSGLDTLRAYRAFAPGGFGYAQGRWEYQGLTLNTGLRAQYFTAGPQAVRQVEHDPARSIWSLAPRLGLSYPISVRDAFSLSYVRIDQAPARDFLYENRVLPFNRQPLGNPLLEPSTVISYQMAVKHSFERGWSLQLGLFFRDLFGQIGARDAPREQAKFRLRYTNDDKGHAEGFEVSALYASGARSRLELHYTYMNAWGTQSLEEGLTYGRLPGEDRRPTSERPDPTGEHPLDWDRHHTLTLSGQWGWGRRCTFAWSTIAGSGLAWTPRERRALLTDLGVVNSRRLSWSESTSLIVRFAPYRFIAFGLEARNLFDGRGDAIATLEGYPHPFINTLYDDYSAYRTQTGKDGGAYWDEARGWVPVNDLRLGNAPRIVRGGVEVTW